MVVGLSDILKMSAQRAGLSEDYADKLRQGLLGNDALMKEYIHYIKTGGFLCEYKLSGLSIADIVVYQIDHFKAAMDQDRLEMKFNSDRMILKAIETMLLMADDPKACDDIFARLMSESGTDGREAAVERIL